MPHKKITAKYKKGMGGVAKLKNKLGITGKRFGKAVSKYKNKK